MLVFPHDSMSIVDSELDLYPFLADKQDIPSWETVEKLEKS